MIAGKQVIQESCVHPFQDDSFFVIQDRRKGRELGGFNSYPTVLNGRTHHRQSLMAVAECTNMCSVTFNDWIYKLKTIKTWEVNSERIFMEMKRQLWSVLVPSLTSIANVQINCSALELDLQLHKDYGGGRSFLVSATLVFSVSSFLYDFVNRLLKIFQLYSEVRKAEWHEPNYAEAENKKLAGEIHWLPRSFGLVDRNGPRFTVLCRRLRLGETCHGEHLSWWVEYSFPFDR